VATLAWKARGPARRIETILDGRLFWQRYTDLPEEGTLTVTVPDYGRNQITYLLIVSRPEPGAQDVSSQATVTLLCLDEWFFEPAPTGCPHDPSVTTPAAAQTFEHGRMLWRDSDGAIYVLFEDGRQPQYQRYSDPWLEGQPDSDPSIVPPSGYYQPVRGFGRIWREAPTVRDRLGWATALEAEFQMTYQYDAIWSSSHSDRSYCYMRGPQGEIIRLSVGGWSWEIVPGE
jgi:hypothetical protein